MTPEQQIAEFLTRKGATRIAEGTRALDYTGREWAAKVRGETVRREERQNAEDRRVRMVTDHAGREFFMNAEGEWL